MDPVSSHGARARRALATRTEQSYMAIAVAEAVVVVSVAFAYFGLVQANVPAQDAKTRTVPVYITIFIFAQIFSMLYVFDALRARNTIQLLLHTGFNIFLFIYSTIQIPQTRTALASLGPGTRCGRFAQCVGQGSDSLFNTILGLLVVTPVVIGLATVAFGIMLRQVYSEFGWAEFRLVGASVGMKRMHRMYQTLVSLLKLLFFFATSFCIAFLILVIRAQDKTAEFVITVIALPLTPIVILACGWAVRMENKSGMIACLFLMLAGLAYFVYKLASMFMPHAAQLYINTRVTMVLFACFAIIILMATFIFGCICYVNFGRGLLEAHMDPANKTSLWSFPEQLIRTADRADKDTYETGVDMMTGQGYNRSARPSHGHSQGSNKDGRLVID